MTEDKPRLKTFSQLRQMSFFVCLGITPSRIMFKSCDSGAQKVKKVYRPPNCTLEHEIEKIDLSAEVQELDLSNFSA